MISPSWQESIGLIQQTRQKSRSIPYRKHHPKSLSPRARCSRGATERAWLSGIPWKLGISNLPKGRNSYSFSTWYTGQLREKSSSFYSPFKSTRPNVRTKPPDDWWSLADKCDGRMTLLLNFFYKHPDKLVSCEYNPILRSARSADLLMITFREYPPRGW